MCAFCVYVCHCMVISMHREAVTENEHRDLLKHPQTNTSVPTRMQVGVSALLLVALTFYSTLVLGRDTRPEDDIQRPAALAVLCVLVIPFGLFLWWLTLGRILAHKVMSW